MKIGVVGSTGMLGEQVVQTALDRGHTVEMSKVQLERDFSATNFDWGQDVLINCSGKIALKHPSPREMIMVNSLAPWKLAKIAEEIGFHLIHMSTDAVFSGRATKPLMSSSNPDPIDLYGRSKLAGEPLDPYTTVVRGSFIGPDHGFLHWLLHAKSPVQAWNRVTWNGGSVKVMARTLIDIAENEEYQKLGGVLHVAAQKSVTKAWMVEYLVRGLNLPIDVIHLTDVPVIRRALEPDIVLPPVQESLDELIEELEEEWKRPPKSQSQSQ